VTPATQLLHEAPAPPADAEPVAHALHTALAVVVQALDTPAPEAHDAHGKHGAKPVAL
jgi:hypothetical protein